MTLEANPSDFLGRSAIINFDSPEVATTGRRLAGTSVESTAKRCFEFVRDEIKHSSDYHLNPVTCSASEVIQHRTGYCYAKSHLLCALLRANGIPAGLCYQRLSIDGNGAPFCLHGLAAVHLPDIGWYRIDPRGNRDDIDAQFDPPNERLAFATDMAGERNIPTIFVEPIPSVIAALSSYETWDALLCNLPDVTTS